MYLQYVYGLLNSETQVFKLIHALTLLIDKSKIASLAAANPYSLIHLV